MSEAISLPDAMLVTRPRIIVSRAAVMQALLRTGRLAHEGLVGMVGSCRLIQAMLLQGVKPDLLFPAFVVRLVVNGSEHFFLCL